MARLKKTAEEYTFDGNSEEPTCAGCGSFIYNKKAWRDPVTGHWFHTEPRCMAKFFERGMEPHQIADRLNLETYEVTIDEAGNILMVPEK